MGRDQWNRQRLLQVSGQYWKSSALHAGVKLGVFTELAHEQLSAEEVSRRLSCDQRAMTMLMNALTAIGLLEKSGPFFNNTKVAQSLLSRNSPDYSGYMVMHHHHLVDSWSRLDEAVKGGKAVRGRVSHDSEEWRENFLMGMFNNAMGIAPAVADIVDLSGREDLLDLGGGPGTYGIHFCLKNLELRATVYDLATTRPFAEKTIQRFGLSDRVHFVPGDYLSDPIPGDYDVAWLSHILHAEGHENCRRIIAKAVSCLRPGGLIMIHEFILNDTKAGPVFPALFSLNMLLGTPEGQSYCERELFDMLTEAGVQDIQRLDFTGPNDSGIVAGLVG
ncbi:MAG: methyltransferase domain-containing protein [Deltaproteobacteria bacterium]|nr:methyltransferase domain-containing protein [Deltaproteobacteria bacterium]